MHNSLFVEIEKGTGMGGISSWTLGMCVSIIYVIYFSLDHCVITDTSLPDEQVYPVHSFASTGTCKYAVLGADFSATNGGVSVSWRKFHFNVGHARQEFFEYFSDFYLPEKPD